MIITPVPEARGCALPSSALVERLKQIAPVRTDEGLNAVLGISYNSWRKIMAGQPIRSSVLKRLEDRVRQFDAR